jgi:ketosteroid isomerase-like protein
VGEAEFTLFNGWLEELGAADDPVEVFYQGIWAPDIDYRTIQGAPDDVGPIRGRDAMRAYLRKWRETFPDLAVVGEEVIDAGPETVIVVWKATGTGKASGAVTDFRFAQVNRIRNGKIVWGREYMTKDEAIGAVAAEGLGY